MRIDYGVFSTNTTRYYRSSLAYLAEYNYQSLGPHHLMTSNINMKELRSACKKANLSTIGTADELTERLKFYHEKGLLFIKMQKDFKSGYYILTKSRR